MIGNTGLSRRRYKSYVKSMADQYDVLQRSCFNKCIANFTTSVTSEKEIECAENCSAKFFRVLSLINSEAEKNAVALQ
jgi:hypothetical protein